MANPVFILDITEEGIVATHPVDVELPVQVAPSPEDEKTRTFNTIRPGLVTLGCMNLSNNGFEFDSSVISTRAESRFTKFAELMSKLKADDPHKGEIAKFPPITIFGHADPTGDEDYNKELSGRRARAVYGLLTRDVPLWDFLFKNPFGGDDWGMKSIQIMLGFVPRALPFYLGPIDGAITPETKELTKKALTDYQTARGITPATGKADDATRKVLFPEYMDAICHFDNNFPFKLNQETDFLCRAADKGRKGDINGCGEFNPILLLSKQEESDFSPAKVALDKELKADRDNAYAPDRRVLVFMFRQGSVIDPAKWPCPRAREGAGGCRERFWSDHKDRLKRDEKRRRFSKSGDTFACRWYHGFAQFSPCEAGTKLWVLRLRVDGSKDKPQPFAQKNYVVIAGEEKYSPVLRGTTDDNGQIVIPAMDDTVQMTLKLDFFGTLVPPPSGLAGTPKGLDTLAFQGEDNFLELKLDCGALKKLTQAPDTAQQRLYNLGFGHGKPGTWPDPVFKSAVRGFQRSAGFPKPKVTGVMDDETRAALKKEHEGP